MADQKYTTTDGKSAVNEDPKIEDPTVEVKRDETIIEFRDPETGALRRMYRDKFHTTGL